MKKKEEPVQSGIDLYFVSNVPLNVTEVELINFFSPIAKAKHCELKNERDAVRSRHAYVGFDKGKEEELTIFISKNAIGKNYLMIERMEEEEEDPKDQPKREKKQKKRKEKKREVTKEMSIEEYKQLKVSKRVNIINRNGDITKWGQYILQNMNLFDVLLLIKKIQELVRACPEVSIRILNENKSISYSLVRALFLFDILNMEMQSLDPEELKKAHLYKLKNQLQYFSIKNNVEDTEDLLIDKEQELTFTKNKKIYQIMEKEEKEERDEQHQSGMDKNYFYIKQKEERGEKKEIMINEYMNTNNYIPSYVNNNSYNRNVNVGVDPYYEHNEIKKNYEHYNEGKRYREDYKQEEKGEYDTYRNKSNNMNSRKKALYERNANRNNYTNRSINNFTKNYNFSELNKMTTKEDYKQQGYKISDVESVAPPKKKFKSKNLYMNTIPTEGKSSSNVLNNINNNNINNNMNTKGGSMYFSSNVNKTMYYKNSRGGPLYNPAYTTNGKTMNNPYKHVNISLDNIYDINNKYTNSNKESSTNKNNFRSDNRNMDRSTAYKNDTVFSNGSKNYIKSYREEEAESSTQQEYYHAQTIHQPNEYVEKGKKGNGQRKEHEPHSRRNIYSVEHERKEENLYSEGNIQSNNNVYEMSEYKNKSGLQKQGKENVETSPSGNIYGTSKERETETQKEEKKPYEIGKQIMEKIKTSGTPRRCIKLIEREHDDKTKKLSSIDSKNKNVAETNESLKKKKIKTIDPNLNILLDRLQMTLEEIPDADNELLNELINQKHILNNILKTKYIDMIKWPKDQILRVLSIKKSIKKKGHSLHNSL